MFDAGAPWAARGGEGLSGFGGVEVWRGSVNAWECDEMGHMNVRFYLARAREGLVGTMAALGMEGAFRDSGDATALVLDHHVRFIREARAGAPLFMRAGLISLGESDARILQLIIHAGSGEIAASVQTLVRHATAREGRPFSWSRRTRDLAPGLLMAVPDRAAPRGLALDPSAGDAALSAANRLNLACIGAGAFGPADTDVFGRVRPDVMIGRISDGVPTMNEEVGAPPPPPPRIGGAVLEYRLAYLAWPRAGDRFEIRSGLTGFDSRVRRVVHWIIDPASGGAWASAEAVAVALDLDARRIIDIDAETRVRLGARRVTGLRF
ncbi:MAG: thioesterase family protein [Caulobacteraceae bacterium]